MRSKFLTYCARILVIIPVIGVLTFSFVKWKWFHDIYEKIEFHIHPDEFQTLCLSNSDYNNLNWIHKHEFVLENIWYDVVKKTWLEDGFCLITVYPDHNEKEFFNFLFKDTNQAPFQESRVLLFDFDKSFFYVFNGSVSILLKDSDDKVRFVLLSCGLDYSQLHGPPPRFLS